MNPGARALAAVAAAALLAAGSAGVAPAEASVPRTAEASVPRTAEASVPRTAVRAGTAPGNDCAVDDRHLIPPSSRLQNFAYDRLLYSSLWKHATGKGVTVAVVDSGVQAGNPHFPEGSLLAGYSNVPGYDDPQVAATLHGTAVAGIIAARPVAGSKVVGIAPDAKILPVRVYVSSDAEYEQQGLGGDSDRIADGIRWAARNGADVINVSMSAPNRSATLDAAVRYATRNGALVVASAGNAEFTDSEPQYTRQLKWPAASPGALGVTAADDDDHVTSFSVHGPHVDVAAPGQSVLTTFHDAGDCAFSGGDTYHEPLTSFATPYVAGAAALVAEKYPRAGPAEIAYRLTASADRPIRDARDDVRGWGFIRPLEGLTMTVDPNRAGPAVPGHERKDGTGSGAEVPVLTLDPDPLAPARSMATWWLMVGAALLMLVLILNRWRAVAPPRPARRRRRSREVPASSERPGSRRNGDRRGGRGWADATTTRGSARPARSRS